MTKTTVKSRTEADSPDKPEGFDPPYTAHQVHTLVQVLFHKLSSGVPQNRPWSPTTNPPLGFMPGAPPANYWYP
jgi:hypothetical protein